MVPAWVQWYSWALAGDGVSGAVTHYLIPSLGKGGRKIDQNPSAHEHFALAAPLASQLILERSQTESYKKIYY